MPFKTPVYPEILTNASWQRNKGLVAKMAGETRVGELMTRAKAAYDAVNWGKFDLPNVLPFKRTLEDINQAYQQARLEGGKIKKLNDEIRDLENTAGQLAATWRNEKTIPTASAKHAQAVSDAAKTFNYATTMATISAALEKEKKEADDNWKKAEGAKDSNQTFKAAIDKFLTRAEKDIQLRDYPGFWSQCIRMPSFKTVAQNHPEFRAEYNEWSKYADKEVRPATPEQLTQQLRILIKAALSAKSKFNLLA